MKNRKNKKANKIKEIIKMLIESAILAIVVIGIFTLLGNFVEWTCADGGRFALVMVIMAYGLYRIFKAEFGE